MENKYIKVCGIKLHFKVEENIILIIGFMMDNLKEEIFLDLVH
jgi:hypothetical protein